ncbi:MAG TPA: GPW/gp25 family protein [Puia sp.]|jgi:phage baseplate assembly protein W|nr:GPW/gp25 family protein [Puia sp.]
MDNSFLGTGWSFPPAFDAALGSCRMVTNEVDIEQSLNILLSTMLGERVMQPQYGCDLQPYVFSPLNPHMVGYLKDRVRNAVLFYESRIKIEKLEVTAADSTDAIEGRFRITLTYTVTQTNTRFNYVYDYFQNEALEPL